MATYPAGLPQNPLLGYTEKITSPLIRSEMETGSPKVRRRFTSAIRTFNVRFILTKAQVATLETFYVTTTNYGADAFTFENWRTDASVSMRFVDSPSYTAISTDIWEVSMELEQLP